MSATARGLLFWLGLTLYIGSFGLVAASTPGGPTTGFQCVQDAVAFLTFLINEFLHRGKFPFGSPLQLAALLIVSFINPVFVLCVFRLRLKPFLRPLSALRIALLCMIPFCWIIFREQGMSPRLGHFVWIIGMLMVVFSEPFRASGNKLSAP